MLRLPAAASAADVTVTVIPVSGKCHGGTASGPRGAASERRRAARPSLEGSLGSTLALDSTGIRECHPDIDGVPDSLTGGSGTATSTAVTVANTGGPQSGRHPW